MIDLHAHVLPGLDDGPAVMSDAIGLVRAAAASGTRTIVATPHVDLRHGVRPRQIAAAVAALNAALADAGVEVEILPGAEIALERLIDLTPADLDLLGLGGGSCLLVEPPLRPLPGAFEWPIQALLDEGDRRVLLAHPERCPGFQVDPTRLERLVDAGAMCQLTTGALTGDFGRRVRDSALRLARSGRVHDLASDMHDRLLRPPSLLAGLEVLEREQLASPEQLSWLVADAPAAIIADASLPAWP